MAASPKWSQEVADALLISEATYLHGETGFDAVAFLRKHSHVKAQEIQYGQNYCVLVESSDAVWFGIRGSHVRDDFITDFTFLPSQSAHSGFVSRARCIPIRDLYQHARKRGKPLIFCGHSLGGAVAHLCTAWLLLEEGKRKDHVRSIGFGAPMVCQEDMAKRLQPFERNFLTIVNPGDLVVNCLNLRSAAVTACRVMRHVNSVRDLFTTTAAPGSSMSAWLASLALSGLNYAINQRHDDTPVPVPVLYHPIGLYQTVHGHPPVNAHTDAEVWAMLEIDIPMLANACRGVINHELHHYRNNMSLPLTEITTPSPLEPSDFRPPPYNPAAAVEHVAAAPVLVEDTANLTAKMTPQDVEDVRRFAAVLRDNFDNPPAYDEMVSLDHTSRLLSGALEEWRADLTVTEVDLVLTRLREGGLALFGLLEPAQAEMILRRLEAVPILKDALAAGAPSGAWSMVQGGTLGVLAGGYGGGWLLAGAVALSGPAGWALGAVTGAAVAAMGVKAGANTSAANDAARRNRVAQAVLQLAGARGALLGDDEGAAAAWIQQNAVTIRGLM